MDLQLLAVDRALAWFYCCSAGRRIFPRCLLNSYQVKRILPAKTPLLYASEAGSLSLQEIAFVRCAIEVIQQIVLFSQCGCTFAFARVFKRAISRGNHCDQLEGSAHTLHPRPQNFQQSQERHSLETLGSASESSLIGGSFFLSRKPLHI